MSAALAGRFFTMSHQRNPKWPSLTLVIFLVFMSILSYVSTTSPSFLGLLLRSTSFSSSFYIYFVFIFKMSPPDCLSLSFYLTHLLIWAVSPFIFNVIVELLDILLVSVPLELCPFFSLFFGFITFCCSIFKFIVFFSSSCHLNSMVISTLLSQAGEFWWLCPWALKFSFGSFL